MVVRVLIVEDHVARANRIGEGQPALIQSFLAQTGLTLEQEPP